MRRTTPLLPVRALSTPGGAPPGASGSTSGTCYLVSESWKGLNKVLTTKRLELLHHLRRHPAGSVAVLARALGRDYKRVHEDVEALAASGLLARDQLGLRTEYDEIRTSIAVWVGAPVAVDLRPWRRTSVDDEMGLRVWRRAGRGDGADEGAARRQGREPGRDEQSGPAGAPRLHHLHRGLQPATTPTAAPIPTARRPGRRGAGRRRAGARQPLRRPRRPAAGLRALRRPGLDAGHDGHHPEPGPERQTVEGLAGQRQPRASPTTATAASSRCTRDVVLEVDHDVRGGARGPEAGARRHARHRARRPTTWRSWSSQLQGDRREGDRQAVPAGSAASSSGAPSAPSSAPG